MPREQVEHWLELIRELDTARISTIHAFCGIAAAVARRRGPARPAVPRARRGPVRHAALRGGRRGAPRQGWPKAARRRSNCWCSTASTGWTTMIAGFLGERQQIDWAAWRRKRPTGWSPAGKTTGAATRCPPRCGSWPIARRPAGAGHRPAERPCEQPAMQERCAVLVELLPSLAESPSPAADAERLHEAARVQGAARSSGPARRSTSGSTRPRKRSASRSKGCGRC